MAAWTLDDIPWARFDRSRVDPAIAAIVKAASLVEMNGGTYADYLCRVFADDPDFQTDVRRWGAEEEQHGEALGRWAALADPQFDFVAASARFRQGYRPDFDRDTSRRGSRSGEMIARCIVETGTSSYYAALRDAAREPVLKVICGHIAADEIRHYRLFRHHLARCLEHEPIRWWRRLRIAFGRIAETQDDELAYAYHAANETARPYDRRRCARAYASHAFVIYREPHVARAVKMILKTVGLRPNGPLARAAGRVAWAALRWRAVGVGDCGGVKA
ncbi:MAG: acyl-ACP desaturase [Stellaceae bacterium]